MNPDDTQPEINEAILRVVDTIGALMEFWGFKRNMGRMWTLLYLEPRPLSAAELGERLTLSTGAVSMTLADLVRWGAVKKTWVPGERRDYYEPETSIWKMISRVFRERELLQIREAIEVFDQAVTTIKSNRQAARRRATREQDDRLGFALSRISALSTLAHIGERLLDSILSGKAVDAAPLESFMSDGGDDPGEKKGGP
jgi:HTH-type transcriptional regulator, glycine betaine synthesis regulator